MSDSTELAVVTQEVASQRRFRCRHIHAAGHRCGSPALRQQQFCYYHHATRRPAPHPGKFRHLDATEPFPLPVVEDRASALQVASQLLMRIASNDLDPHRAGALLYNLQIITALLPREPQSSAVTLDAERLPQPPVEYTILDETLGLLAPIAELPDHSIASSSGLPQTSRIPARMPVVKGAPMPQPKPGDRFSFSFLDEQAGVSHRAVVERILSNHQEGLSPEIDEYVADWLEALPLNPAPAPAPSSATPIQPITVMLGTNGKTYIQGRLVTLTFDRQTHLA